MANPSDYTVLPLAGRLVTRACGVTFHESGANEIDLLFLQLQDPEEWCRFCLGEGVAYWDIVTNQSANDEIGDYHGQVTELINCPKDLTICLLYTSPSPRD